MYSRLFLGGLGQPIDDFNWKPDDHTAENVMFFLNNVQQNNVVDKARELHAVTSFTPYFCQWLAKTLLVTRVFSQHNHLSTYYHLMIALKSPELEKQVREETFRQIRKFLSIERVTKTAVEKQALKNLGTWLGFMTIARNKPMSYRDLNLGEILKAAEELGDEEMTYVVPLITKMLRASRMSSICGPESAYTKSLLNLLVELHQVEKLKMNVKFEIEILFRDLHVQLDKNGNEKSVVLRFANIIGCPIVAAEKIMAVHKVPVTIPEPIPGIDEELIMQLNGFHFEMPTADCIRALVNSRGPLQIIAPHVNSGPTEVLDVTVIKPFVESLLRNVYSNYFARAGLTSQMDGVTFILDQLKVKSYMSGKSVIPFISVTLRCAVHVCTDMERESPPSFKRHFCIHLLDTVALVIKSSLDHYSNIEMKLEVLRMALETIVDTMGADLSSNGYRRFVAFPYFRVLLSFIREVTKSCEGNNELLCRFQSHIVQAMIAIDPLKMPVCAFEWLNIVGNPDVLFSFINNSAYNYTARDYYINMVIAGLKFLDKFLNSHRVSRPIVTFYEGLVRLITFLNIHSDILSDYANILCPHVPQACHQLHSLIVTAKPRMAKPSLPFS